MVFKGKREKVYYVLLAYTRRNESGVYWLEMWYDADGKFLEERGGECKIAETVRYYEKLGYKLIGYEGEDIKFSSNYNKIECY